MFVAINGVRVFFDVLNPKLEVLEDGLREKPVLICIPGGPGGNHQTLRPSLDRLADLAQVIYLDPRASGRSERGDPASWTLDQWGDDVAAFCDSLGIERPFVLGVSGGAIVAQAYMARHPHHAGGVILVNPCARMVKSVLVDGFGRLGGPEAAAAAEAMYSRGAMEDAPAFFRHCMPHYSRKGVFGPPGAANRVMINFDVSRHFFSTGGEAFRFDHRAALGSVESRVLALIGAHDPVTRPEWGRELVKALPAGLAETVVFDDASHMIAADDPERFFAAIEQFVRSL